MTILTGTTAAEVMAELATLEDPKVREVNQRHRDEIVRRQGVGAGASIARS